MKYTQRIRLFKSSLKAICIITVLSFALIFFLNNSAEKKPYFNPHNVGFPFIFDQKFLGYRFIPGIEGENWGSKFTINSHGFRGEDFAFKKKQNEIRIIAIGDSCVFGSTVDDADTYCHKLENVLNDNQVGRSYKFRVINAGLPGISTFKGLQYYKSYVSKYKPDILLIQFGWNDHGKEFLTDRTQFYKDSAIKLLTQFNIEKYSTGESNQKKIFTLNPSKVFYKVPPNEYLHNINQIVNFAKQNGVKDIILITSPSEPRKFHDGLGSYYDIFEVHKYYANLTRRVAKKRNLHIVDLERLFIDKFSSDLNYYFNDHVHFNALGHTIQAGEIYNYLNGHNIIPGLFKKRKLSIGDVVLLERDQFLIKEFFRIKES